MTRQIHKPLLKDDRQPRPELPPIGAWIHAPGSGFKGMVTEHLLAGNRGPLVRAIASDGTRGWFAPGEVVDAGED